MKIAFIQLGSWGDCCNSTLMFKPLLDKYKDAEIHVFTTTLYQSAFTNNRFVKTINPHPCTSKTHAFDLYNTVPDMVRKSGIYDKVFCPAPILMAGKRNSLRHPELGENLWCSFLRALEDDDVPYTLPPVAELNLTVAEVANANKWLQKLPPAHNKRVIMECYAESGQTYWNESWMTEVTKVLLKRGHQVIMSNKGPTKAIDALVNQGAHLANIPLRECVHVFNSCEAFISISSGFCNACCSSAAKRDALWFEAVNSDTCSSRILRAGRKDSHYWYHNDCAGFIDLITKNGL